MKSAERTRQQGSHGRLPAPRRGPEPGFTLIELPAVRKREPKGFTLIELLAFEET